MQMYSYVTYLSNDNGDGYYGLVHVQAETEDTAYLNGDYYLSSLHKDFDTGDTYQLHEVDEEEAENILRDGDFIGPFTASARTS